MNFEKATASVWQLLDKVLYVLCMALYILVGTPLLIVVSVLRGIVSAVRLVMNYHKDMGDYRRAVAWTLKKDNMKELQAYMVYQAPLEGVEEYKREIEECNKKAGDISCGYASTEETSAMPRRRHILREDSSSTESDFREST